MSWHLPITPQHSTAPLTPERLAPGPRPWLTERVAACRACTHVARGGQTCAACDLRCAHPLAADHPPLIAVATSTCPAGLWPLTT